MGTNGREFFLEKAFPTEARVSFSAAQGHGGIFPRNDSYKTNSGIFAVLGMDFSFNMVYIGVSIGWTVVFVQNIFQNFSTCEKGDYYNE